MSITLEIPSLAHKKACEKMIAEWMRFGGEIHPGLLRRYSERQGGWSAMNNGWNSLLRQRMNSSCIF